MQEPREDYYSVSDIVRKARVFAKHLLRKGLILGLFLVIGIGAGGLYYLIQKPKYEAVSTFILEEKQGGMGGLGSIASQFGVDLGSVGSGGSLFAGDNILDILKSKTIINRVLSSVIDTSSGETLGDLYLDISGLKAAWKNKSKLSGVKYARPAGGSISDSVQNIVYDAIIKKGLTAERVSKKGTIIMVRVKSSNRTFAKLMTERLVNEASKFYLNIKTGNEQANIYRMQRRADSLLALLNSRSYNVAASQQIDVNPGLKSVVVPTEIAARDKAVVATLYTEIIKNLETAKLLLSQQTPVIQLLDTPANSLYDNKKSLIFLIVVSVFASEAICVAILFSIFLLKQFKANSKN